MKNIIFKDLSPVLFTDIDGVSINWLQGYIDFMSSKGYEALHTEPEHFTMIDIFPDLDKPYQFVHDFHHSEFYDNVKAYKQAAQGYKVLYDMGVKIVAVTSCGNQQRVIESRKNNIKSHFGDIFDEVHTLDVGQDKFDILSQYEKGIFIDDQINNVLSGVRAGHLGCLWDMSYNKKETLPENTLRTNSWQDLVDYFKIILSTENQKKNKLVFA